MTLQFGASLTDDTRSVNYDHNMFIIQATGLTILTLYTTATLTCYDSVKNVTVQSTSFTFPSTAITLNPGTVLYTFWHRAIS